VPSPSGRDVTVSGMVESVSLSADSVAGLFGVRVSFDNPDGVLIPGTVTRSRSSSSRHPTPWLSRLRLMLRAMIISSGSWIRAGSPLSGDHVGWQGDDAVEIVAVSRRRPGLSRGQNMLTDNALVKITGPEK